MVKAKVCKTFISGSNPDIPLIQMRRDENDK